MSRNLPRKPPFYLKNPWWSALHPLAGASTYQPSPREVSTISKEEFDKWYDQVFDNAVEVYGQKAGGWFRQYGSEDTHRGLVINIQPIKEESAEDILKEIVTTVSTYEGIVEKAKRFLERKSNG